MKNELTDITLVVDRSGSMDSIQSDAEGGINSFIKEQASLEGDALLTLIQFDTEYEFIHRGEPINSIPQYSLVPRGMTALLDAVGRGINETGDRLAKMKEEDRPGLVVFVVMTDGLENSSKEFTKEQVRKLIEHQQSKYNWQFIFLGADQDAFSEAEAMGIQISGAAHFAKAKVAATYKATSQNVGRMRQQAQQCEIIENAFTDEEREEMQ